MSKAKEPQPDLGKEELIKRLPNSMVETLNLVRAVTALAAIPQVEDEQHITKRATNIS